MRRRWRGVTPSTCAACNQVNWRASTFMITSRRVIARTSRRTRRSMSSIARLYPTGRNTQAIADELKHLDHETLILWGREDPFQKPAYAEKIRNVIPNAELTWIDDAAHWIMEEKPADVAAVLKAFLGKGSKR
jgi:pimeloyl-ACP methyl ester carboxylesterase